jgi:murein DD-endopeptidase MepM/ murein hydrolase activator NlpD
MKRRRQKSKASLIALTLAIGANGAPQTSGFTTVASASQRTSQSAALINAASAPAPSVTPAPPKTGKGKQKVKPAPAGQDKATTGPVERKQAELEPTPSPTDAPVEAPVISLPRIPVISLTEIPANDPVERPTASPDEIATTSPVEVPTVDTVERPTASPIVAPPAKTPVPRSAIITPTKPVVKPGVEPVVKPGVKPAVKPGVKPAVKPALPPAPRSVATPTPEPAPSARKPALPPVATPATKPAPRLPARPAAPATVPRVEPGPANTPAPAKQPPSVATPRPAAPAAPARTPANPGPTASPIPQPPARQNRAKAESASNPTPVPATPVTGAAATKPAPAPAAKVTAADIASAEAALQQAQQRLQALLAGPDPQLVNAARQRLSDAQASFQQIVAAASSAKTTAANNVRVATDNLAGAQQRYNVAYRRNKQAQAGVDPRTQKPFARAKVAVTARQRQYARDLRAAEAQRKVAEAKLARARATFAQAKQQEITDVAAARAKVDAAQAELNKLLAAPDPAEVRAAQAQVAQAQTRLDELKRDFHPPAPVRAGAWTSASRVQPDRSVKQVSPGKLDQIAQKEAPADLAEAQAQMERARARLGLRLPKALAQKGWMWPSFGSLSSLFGLRDFFVGRFHNGIDIANVEGTPIGAAWDGVVVEAGWCSGYGYCVKLRHRDGFSTEYGHLAEQPPVKVGQSVKAGAIIGVMGTTYDSAHGGYSTGVHLHFTVKRWGEAVDPLLYLP